MIYDSNQLTIATCLANLICIKAAKSANVVEYAYCISAEGVVSTPQRVTWIWLKTFW